MLLLTTHPPQLHNAICERSDMVFRLAHVGQDDIVDGKAWNM